MRHHARLLAGAGHGVVVVAGRGQPVDDQVAFASVPVVDSQNPEVLTVKWDLDQGRVPQEFELLSIRIEKELLPLLMDADWLICHNVCSLNKNLALTAALHRLSESRERPRLILWHHDLAWTTTRYAAELHDGYPWDLLRTDWPEVNQVTVSSARQAELAKLMSIGLDRIRVIPNGIDVGEFLGLGTECRDLVREFDLLRASPLILLPVRITPRKNIELALEILAALRAHLPEARLLVTGPVGPHNPANVDYLQRLLALRQELKLEGAATFVAEASAELLPDEVVAELYRVADLVLLPSYEEGFGLPILEAGLAGVPIFCSGIPALRELGGEAVTYFSTNAAAVDIAQAIASALEASARYKLRRRILRQYTWDAIYSSHLGPMLEDS
jgi:glycosyltransferase involved in cell wall biosynthesis